MALWLDYIRLIPFVQLKNNPKDVFILHDGPPYANGNVHSGKYK